VTVNYAATAIATVLTLGFLLVPFSVLFGLID
jgi:succinate dehydrogenase / fumarate reductase cytochrome b subunit